MINQERIRHAVRTIIEAIGEDPYRQGLEETPRRIAEMYAELFSGLEEDPREVLAVAFEADQDEMVVLKDIPFYSLCEHHLLPFHGQAHVAYIPAGRVVGLSKVARVVDILARRPQVQERLTCQVADAIMEALQPQGVAVVIEAEHLCISMRGIKKPGSMVVTSAIRGLFRQKMATRQEFFAIIRGDRGKP